MKKIIFVFIAIVIVLFIIIYNVQDYKIKYSYAQRVNAEFEKYYNVEIMGTELTTIINKAMDYNSRNNVNKDEKNIIIENDEDSIKIDIKLMDDKNKIYPMEIFYNNQMERFVDNYRGIKFKCTKIEYHEKSKKVRYMFFEQVSE